MVIISTLAVLGYEKNTKKDVSTIGNKVVKKKEFWSKAKQDSHRKLNHVLMFIGLVAVWYIGLFIARDVTGSSAGMIPEENNMLLLYLRLLTKPYSIMEVLFSLGWFYYLLFSFFYILFLFMFANEITRKQKNLYFPFTFFTKLLLSERETQSYGTYLFFTIGQLFAAFVCPPMVFFAILGIGSISDLMTSQIGIRFGKTHISWNKKKTWEGSIAGVIVTFVICVFFIGIVWSLIFAIAFLIFDIFTDKPINISDNLLIPIGCSLIYILVRFFFNLDYYTILLLWI
jgi:dolichol kinase